MTDLTALSTQIRRLFGSAASAIDLEAELTSDPPRSLYATGLRVYTARNQLLAPNYAALMALRPLSFRIDTLELETETSSLDLSSEASYHRTIASAGAVDQELLELLLTELISNGTPFELVQALNTAATAVGWQRLRLGPAAPYTHLA
jgi:hypothetical protein